MRCEIHFGYACNYQCPYCLAANERKIYGDGVMSPNEIEKIIAFLETSPKPVEQVLLLGGEPTLVDWFPEAFAPVRKFDGCTFMVLTNGENVNSLEKFFHYVGNVGVNATIHRHAFIHDGELNERKLREYLYNLGRFGDRVIYNILLESGMMSDPASLKFLEMIFRHTDGKNMYVGIVRYAAEEELAQTVKIMAELRGAANNETMRMLLKLANKYIVGWSMVRRFGKPCRVWSNLLAIDSHGVYNTHCNRQFLGFQPVPLDDRDGINALLADENHVCHVPFVHTCEECFQRRL